MPLLLVRLCSLILLALLPATARADDKPVLVAAAASLGKVLPRVAEAWRQHGGTTVSFLFDASSRLAVQIENGVPADVFISADTDWMDYLEKKSLLTKGSRMDLLGNELVLVVPKGSTVPPTVEALKGDAYRHLALAGESVPAGKYARAALRSLGVWDALKPKVVNGANVQAVVDLVAHSDAEAGVVYRTDAMAEPRVTLAFAFPPKTHQPIVYPAALISRSPQAAKFLEFCGSAEAKAIFEAAGFKTLGTHP